MAGMNALQRGPKTDSFLSNARSSRGTCGKWLKPPIHPPPRVTPIRGDIGYRRTSGSLSRHCVCTFVYAWRRLLPCFLCFCSWKYNLTLATPPARTGSTNRLVLFQSNLPVGELNFILLNASSDHETQSRHLRFQVWLWDGCLVTNSHT